VAMARGPCVWRLSASDLDGAGLAILDCISPPCPGDVSHLRALTRAFPDVRVFGTRALLERDRDQPPSPAPSPLIRQHPLSCPGFPTPENMYESSTPEGDSPVRFLPHRSRDGRTYLPPGVPYGRPRGRAYSVNFPHPGAGQRQQCFRESGETGARGRARRFPLSRVGAGRHDCAPSKLDSQGGALQSRTKCSPESRLDPMWGLV
jgi:hypothetical protein